MLITIEEGSIGGFGAQVFQALSDDGALDGTRGAFKFRSMTLPDVYIDHDKHEMMMRQGRPRQRAPSSPRRWRSLGDEKRRRARDDRLTIYEPVAPGVPATAQPVSFPFRVMRG